MEFMDFLYNVLTILVIGVTVTGAAYLIIMKINKDKKKASDDDLNKLGILLTQIPDVITSTAEKFDQIQAEKKQKAEYERWKQVNNKKEKKTTYRDLYPDLDGFDEEK